jgi:uncharacterized protein (DUF4415 family)
MLKQKPDHISQEDWDAVDSPPLTDEQLARLKPARKFLRPAELSRLTKGRGSQKALTKKLVSLRLDQDVLDHFRATGDGWHKRINETLRDAMKREKV